MTNEELAQFATVQEKSMVFFKDFEPKGYYLRQSYTEGTYKDSSGVKWMWVIAQVETLNKDDKVISNGYAREEQGISEFNKMNYFLTAFTKAAGRNFNGLGILVEKSIASREEIEASEDFMRSARKQERVARTPKVKAPNVRANLKRLRVHFEEKDDCYIIEKYKHFSDKTTQVLQKYGFNEVNDKLILAKEKDSGS